MTRRPCTVHDATWNLVCMLCTTLPTISNGLAVPFDRPDGKRGIRLTYTIQPEARWGDGTPVTTADVLFTYEAGRHPLTGIGNAERYRRITTIEGKDDKTSTLARHNPRSHDGAMHDYELLPPHRDRPT